MTITGHSASERTIGIAEFIRAIDGLPSDPPMVRPGAWYRTQKEHWLGWLHDYEGPGAYGRAIGRSRDARFAYNHIVCPGMLLWLGEAAGVEPERVAAARAAAEGLPTQMHQAAAIRRHVPWSVVYAALFG